MGWKTAATVLIVVFVVLLLQAVLAGPMVSVVNDINDSGDYSNDHFDGNSIIDGFLGAWFNMGLVAVFGMMAWAVTRVVRREITRGQR